MRILVRLVLSQKFLEIISRCSATLFAICCSSSLLNWFYNDRLMIEEVYRNEFLSKSLETQTLRQWQDQFLDLTFLKMNSRTAISPEFALIFK